MREIGIGIVGGGYMGKRHAVAMSAVGATFSTALRPRLVSVAASTHESAARYRDAYGFDRAAPSWEALVDDPAVEAVVVTTFPDTHRAISEAAIRRGKPVLCEKPLGATVADAEAMAALARERGVTAMVGYNYRRIPAFDYARQLVREGAVGEPVHLRATHMEDYLADPATPHSRRTRAKGDGAMGDIGSHALDMMVALLGPIEAVFGTMRTVIAKRPDESGAMEPVANEDEADVLVRFASGARGTAHVSRVSVGAKLGYGFELVGSNGAIRFDAEDQDTLHLYRREGPEAMSGFTRILAGPEHGAYAAFCDGPGHGTGYGDQITIEARDFLDAIDRGVQPETDFDHGVLIDRAVEAVRRSSERDEWTSP